MTSNRPSELHFTCEQLPTIELTADALLERAMLDRVSAVVAGDPTRIWLLADLPILQAIAPQLLAAGSALANRLNRANGQVIWEVWVELRSSNELPMVQIVGDVVVNSALPFGFPLTTIYAKDEQGKIVEQRHRFVATSVAANTLATTRECKRLRATLAEMHAELVKACSPSEISPCPV